MAKLYKVTEWEDPLGKWWSNNVQELATISAKWWVPARMLNMSLTDYILMLKNEYNANIISYHPDSDVLIFNWTNYADCHKYTLFINAKARKLNYIV